MYYLQPAWHSVKETTIANCNTKAGFKTAKGTHGSAADPTIAVTDSVDNDVDDPLDDLPLTRLVAANVTMGDFVSIDDDVPTCEEMSDDAIIDKIDVARENSPGEDDSGDDQTTEFASESPSVDMALKACKTLRLILQTQLNVTDILEKLCHVDKYVSQIDLSKRCAKQALITDFSRM